MYVILIRECEFKKEITELMIFIQNTLTINKPI